MRRIVRTWPLELRSQTHPVVLAGGGVADALIQKWSLPFLTAAFADAPALSVIRVPAERVGCTLFYAADNEVYLPAEICPSAPCEVQAMRFETFLAEIGFSPSPRGLQKPADSFYLQQLLFEASLECESPSAKTVIEEGWKLGECARAIKSDLAECIAWDLLAQMGYGIESLCRSTLFVSVPGSWSQLHFDTNDNLFLQVRGRKRVLLFPPSLFPCLYPYPVRHPHDRHSQLALDQAEMADSHFSRAKELAGQGLEIVLEQGEMLHIPPLWWHQIETFEGHPCISINLWFAGCGLSPDVLGADFNWAWPEAWAAKERGRVARCVAPTSPEGYVLLLRVIEERVASICFDLRDRRVTAAFTTTAARLILAPAAELPGPEGEIARLLERCGYGDRASREGVLLALVAGRQAVPSQPGRKCGQDRG